MFNGLIKDLLKDIMSQLTILCLPDGIHAIERDSEFFFLQNYNQILYCTFSYYQIETNKRNVVDEFQENVRNSIQKSICIVSTSPLFKLYSDKLSMTMFAFMSQDNLKDKTCFQILYNALATPKAKNETENDIELDLSLIPFLLK